MKSILSLLLLVSSSVYAADSSLHHNTIPPFIKIPYYATKRELLYATPTQEVTIQITPETTPLELQEKLRNTIGQGYLMSGRLNPQRIDSLNNRFDSISKILADEENDLDNDFEVLEDLLYFVPLRSGHTTQPMPPSSKSVPKKTKPQM